MQIFKDKIMECRDFTGILLMKFKNLSIKGEYSIEFWVRLSLSDQSNVCGFLIK